ncbi:hypothetical protein AB4166_02365 [Vibrio splendidus]
MKLRKLKVKILSNSQWYGYECTFTSGLNIIRGDNSSGKSTLVNSIIYSLGMEELIGYKGPSSLPYALVSYFQLEEQRYDILESYCLLELENSSGEVITLKRHIHSQNVDSKLVQVIQGAYLSADETVSFDSIFTYLHDAGSATNSEFGFYAYFERFLGLDLPLVSDNKGNSRKLYLQYIFSALFIEQKRGWTNYIANAPFYGISDVTSKIVSYLLNLDTFSHEAKLKELKTRRNNIITSWSETVSNFKLIVSNGHLFVKALPSSAVIGFNPSSVFIGQGTEETKGIKLLIDEAVSYLEEINRNEKCTLQAEEPDLVTSIETVQERISELLITQKLCGDDIRVNESKAKLYGDTLSSIEDDLETNKLTNKLNKFGADYHLPIAENVCVTCHNTLDHSLSSPEDMVKNMTIDENIKYLDNQKKMVSHMIYGLNKEAEVGKNKLLSVISELRDKHRELASYKRQIKSVTQDNEGQIRKRFVTENKIEQLNNIYKKTEKELENLLKMSLEYADIQGEIRKLDAFDLSFSDKNKINQFQESFKKYASDFSYRSAKVEDIVIKEETLLPFLKGFELGLLDGTDNKDKSSTRSIANTDIKTDSSASDFVRLIWAYLISIAKISSEKSGNHLGTLLFDEPGQHSMSLESINHMFKALAELKDTQCIVAASFEQNHENYKRSVEGVEFNNLIRLPSKLIQRL